MTKKILVFFSVHSIKTCAFMFYCYVQLPSAILTLLVCHGKACMSLKCIPEPITGADQGRQGSPQWRIYGRFGRLKPPLMSRTTTVHSTILQEMKSLSSSGPKCTKIHISMLNLFIYLFIYYHPQIRYGNAFGCVCLFVSVCPVCATSKKYWPKN